MTLSIFVFQTLACVGLKKCIKYFTFLEGVSIISVKYFLHFEGGIILNGIVIIFFLLLVLSLILIFFTISTLPQLGDERKKLIKMKAQSYSFAVVIAVLVFEMGKKVYSAFWGSNTYEGISPFSFLLSICIIYLITLLFYKRKYGN